jgi:TP901 family phage tail tape measure protein
MAENDDIFVGGIDIGDSASVLDRLTEALKRWNEAGIVSIDVTKDWNDEGELIKATLKGVDAEGRKVTSTITDLSESFREVTGASKELNDKITEGKVLLREAADIARQASRDSQQHAKDIAAEARERSEAEKRHADAIKLGKQLISESAKIEKDATSASEAHSKAQRDQIQFIEASRKAAEAYRQELEKLIAAEKAEKEAELDEVNANAQFQIALKQGIELAKQQRAARFGGPGLRQDLFGSLQSGATRLGGEGFGAGFGRGADIAMAYGSLESVGVGLGASLGALATPAAAIVALGLAMNKLKDAIKEGSDAAFEFEPAILRVGIATGNAEQNTSMLRESVLKLSESFGTDRMDEAKAAYTAITSGVVDATKATDALIEANKLHLITGASVQQSMQAITTALRAFGKENITTAETAALLAQSAQKMGISVDEMSNFLGRAGSNARALGVSAQEVIAFTQTVKSFGASSQEAFMGVSQLLNSLMSKDEVFKLVGMSFKDLVEVSGGFEQALHKLMDAESGATTEGGKLFGSVRGIRGALLESAQATDEYNKRLRDLNNTQADFNKNAAQQAANAEQTILTFTQRISNAFEDAGHKANMFLGKVLEAIEPHQLPQVTKEIEKQATYQGQLTSEIDKSVTAEKQYLDAVNQALHAKEQEKTPLANAHFGDDVERRRKQITEEREARREQEQEAAFYRNQREAASKEAARAAKEQDRFDRQETTTAEKEERAIRREEDRNWQRETHNLKMDNLKTEAETAKESIIQRRELEKEISAEHVDRASANKEIFDIAKQMTGAADAKASPQKQFADQIALLNQYKQVTMAHAEDARASGDLHGFKSEVKDLDSALAEEVAIRTKYAAQDPNSKQVIAAIQQYRIQLKHQEYALEKALRDKEKAEKDSDRKLELDFKHQEHQLVEEYQKEEADARKQERIQESEERRKERKKEFEERQAERAKEFKENQAGQTKEFEAKTAARKQELKDREADAKSLADVADRMKKLIEIQKQMDEAGKVSAEDSAVTIKQKKQQLEELRLKYIEVAEAQAKAFGTTLGQLPPAPKLPDQVIPPKGVSVTSPAGAVDERTAAEAKNKVEGNYVARKEWLNNRGFQNILSSEQLEAVAKGQPNYKSGLLESDSAYKEALAALKAAGLRDGGWVGGPSGPDNTLIAASRGEYVVNPIDAAKNKSMLEQINAGGSFIPVKSISNNTSNRSYSSNNENHFNINVSGLQAANATNAAESIAFEIRRLIRQGKLKIEQGD